MRTYGATLRAIVLKVALKLGTQALPMVSAAQFFSVSGSAVLSGPKSPSTVSAQPGVRRSYVELVKAAVAYWHVVRCERAVFDSHWAPQLGVFWAGIKRACIRAPMGKSPLLLGGVRALCARAGTGSVRLRSALGNSELPSSGPGLGAPVDDALVMRCAVSASVAFLAVRRASQIAALRVSDATVDDSAGAIELKMRCQKNDQLSVGQMAHVGAAPGGGVPAWYA